MRRRDKERSTYVCGHCDTEFNVIIYPPERTDGINPPTPLEVDPADCPNCGAEVDVDIVQELRDEQRVAYLERAAEAREEMRHESK